MWQCDRTPMYAMKMSPRLQRCDNVRCLCVGNSRVGCTMHNSAPLPLRQIRWKMILPNSP